MVSLQVILFLQLSGNISIKIKLIADTLNFHSAGVKNCKMDSNGNIHLQIVDFYNFNEGRTSVKGRVGRKLQEMDDIEPYYIIVNVIIPKDLVKRFYKL